MSRIRTRCDSSCRTEHQSNSDKFIQCPEGTRACLVKTNEKADESPRIVAVIPLAQTSTLNPETNALTSPQGLSIVMHGGDWPPTGSPRKQSLSIKLLCSDNAGDPVFKDYDGEQMTVEWSVPVACEAGHEDEKKDQKVGSGVGWFFLV